MEMHGRLIFECDKEQTELLTELVESHCDVDDSSYKKGIFQIFINGSYDLIEESTDAITSLRDTVATPILGWFEGDEEPCVTMLTSTSTTEVACNKLDSALYEYLEDFEDEDEDESELSEEHQLALALGPKEYFTQQYQAWIAPYDKKIVQKDFKEKLKEIIEGADT